MCDFAWHGVDRVPNLLVLPQASEAGNLSRHAGATKKIQTTFRYLTRRTCLLGRLIYQSGLSNQAFYPPICQFDNHDLKVLM